MDALPDNSSTPPEPATEKLGANIAAAVKQHNALFKRLITEPLVFKERGMAVGMIEKTLLKRIYNTFGDEGLDEIVAWMAGLPEAPLLYRHEYETLPEKFRPFCEQLIEDWNNRIGCVEQQSFIAQADMLDGQFNRRGGLAVLAAAFLGGGGGAMAMRARAKRQNRDATVTEMAGGAVALGLITAAPIKYIISHESRMRYHAPVCGMNVNHPIDMKRCLDALLGWTHQFAGFELSEQKGMVLEAQFTRR